MVERAEIPTIQDLHANVVQDIQVIDAKLRKINVSITTILVSMVIVSEAPTLSNATVIMAMEDSFVIVPSTYVVLILAIIRADVSLTVINPMVTNANAYLALGARIVNKTPMTALTTLVSTENALTKSIAISANVYQVMQDEIVRPKSTNVSASHVKTEVIVLML